MTIDDPTLAAASVTGNDSAPALAQTPIHVAQTPSPSSGPSDPGYAHFFMELVVKKLTRLFICITYPFVIVFTVICTTLFITFCILPTIFLLSIGICIYYIAKEDPVPLTSLLRFVFSPDDSQGAQFPVYNQSRDSLQSKIIIRKILRIDDLAKDSENDIENGEEVNRKKNEEFPRCHPQPIEFRSSQKCLYFSEPIVYEHDEKKDKENNLPVVPFYQRTSNATDQNPSGRLASGTSPSQHMESLDEALAHPPDDIELGMVEIAIGEGGFGENDESREDVATGPISITDTGAVETDPGAQESAGRQETITDEETPVISTVTETIGDVLELVEDYFGITDARERGLTCDICLLNYEVGDEVAWSPNPKCSHSYHKECILDWLVRKPSCPSCRQNYIDLEGDEVGL